MNYQHVIVQMKSLDGTNQRAVRVTTINARLGNNVSHSKSASKCDSNVAQTSGTSEQVHADLRSPSPRSGRQHKAWGGAKRNPRLLVQSFLKSVWIQGE